MPGIAVCCRSDSRYGSRTGMMPNGVKTGCCPDVPVLHSRTTSEANPSSLRMSADQGELRERGDVIAAPRPHEAGTARRRVGTDAHVVLAVAFELHATEEGKAIELVGQPAPRHFLAVGGVGPFDAAIDCA